MWTLLCAICRETLGVESLNKSCTLPCGHVFHDHCIFNWLERSETCPHCRVPSRPQQVIKLYFDVAEDNQLAELETLKKEVNRVQYALESTQTDLQLKNQSCNTLSERLNYTLKANDSLRDEVKALSKKVRKLESIQSEYERQKTELNKAVAALHKQRMKNSKLCSDLEKLQKMKQLLDGSVSESTDAINSETLDFDTMKTCFTTIKRDFTNSVETQNKMRSDLSNLYNLCKSMEKKNNDLTEKCSIQERIIETYKSDLNTSAKRARSPDRSESANLDETHQEPNTSVTTKPVIRRSPRNLHKRSALNMKTKLPTTRQLSYDGLGGHSEDSQFPSAKLKPCKIISNRRK